MKSVSGVAFFFLACILISCGGCIIFAKDTANYKDFFSYMEFSLEKRNCVILRGKLTPNSFLVITDYQITKEESKNGTKYFIKLFSGRASERKNPSVEYMNSWLGMKITLPINKIDPLNDKIFYKDKNETRLIKKGSLETWKKYLKAERDIIVEDKEI